jgi:hypothetical protein
MINLSRKFLHSHESCRSSSSGYLAENGASSYLCRRKYSVFYDCHSAKDELMQIFQLAG